MNTIRRKIIELAYKNKEGHLGSSLSVLDILHVLYHKVINIDEIKEQKQDRPRFILSKGHASLALYVILNSVGLIDDETLSAYCQFDGKLGGHPKRNLKYGIEASTGSLGHGAPISVGISLGYKISNYTKNVYCVLGDGECNEGTIWESALLAAHHKLGNLFFIVDYNHSNDRAIKYNNLLGMFQSFGWFGYDHINGHDQNELLYFLKENKEYENVPDKPKILIMDTIKGYGIKRMENSPHEWHHRIPTEKEYEEMIKELC